MTRLWRDQGKVRDLLAPVCGWFTEGFDTRDLKGSEGATREVKFVKPIGAAALSP